MPSEYQGVGSNQVIGTIATITGVGSGPNSIVTTGSNHGFQTNDQVVISGVVGTSTFAASVNSVLGFAYTITVLSPTTFAITNGATSGAYSSGGTAVDYSCLPPFNIPSDGDTFNAAAWNIAIQALADRTQTIAATIPIQYSVRFSLSGTWLCPAGCYFVGLLGCGSGGGGEAGCAGSTSTTTVQVQGGGGAGAPLGVAFQAVTPGVTYNITIAASAAGGTAPGGAGADGGKTIFAAASPLVEFVGGQGAGMGQDVVAHSLGRTLTIPPSGSTATVIFAPGGVGTGDGRPRRFPCDNNDVRVMEKYPGSTSATIIDNERYQDQTPGAGGYCGAAADIDSTYTNFPGGVSTQGRASAAWAGPGVTFGSYLGGAPGNIGTNAAGPYFGGSGGGGGGGGGFGAGGAGGAGGNATTGAGNAGSPGSSGAANTGAGGGGGGVGGGGTSGGAGGAGGASGSGVLYIFWSSNLGGA